MVQWLRDDTQHYHPPFCPNHKEAGMGNEKGLLLLKMVCPNHDEISEPYRFQRVSHKLATVAAKRLLFELSSLAQCLGVEVGF